MIKLKPQNMISVFYSCYTITIVYYKTMKYIRRYLQIGTNNKKKPMEI